MIEVLSRATHEWANASQEKKSVGELQHFGDVLSLSDFGCAKSLPVDPNPCSSLQLCSEDMQVGRQRCFRMARIAKAAGILAA